MQQCVGIAIDRVLFDGLSITVSDRDRLGVVGINGTGKSTLLRVLAGQQVADRGQVRTVVGSASASWTRPPRCLTQRCARRSAGLGERGILDKLGWRTSSTVGCRTYRAARPSG